MRHYHTSAVSVVKLEKTKREEEDNLQQQLRVLHGAPSVFVFQI